jgi:hypothetical protein
MGKLRYWKMSEIRAVREVYPEKGPLAVSSILPHRSISAIREQARRHGISRKFKKYRNADPS